MSKEFDVSCSGGCADLNGQVVTLANDIRLGLYELDHPNIGFPHDKVIPQIQFVRSFQTTLECTTSMSCKTKGPFLWESLSYSGISAEWAAIAVPVGLVNTSACTSSCSGSPPQCPGGTQAASCNNGQWVCNTPILIDLDGRDVRLTGCDDPVSFDFFGSGSKSQWTWTRGGASEAWLALDRNGNGTIDDGTELFGAVTDQAPASPEERNGFRALALFDQPENGGDGDGQITTSDAVFSHLLLWQDLNHNGVSELSELTSLADANILGLNLDPQEIGRRDEHGNFLRLRAETVTSGQAANPLWTWDVFLVNCGQN